MRMSPSDFKMCARTTLLVYYSYWSKCWVVKEFGVIVQLCNFFLHAWILFSFFQCKTINVYLFFWSVLSDMEPCFFSPCLKLSRKYVKIAANLLFMNSCLFWVCKVSYYNLLKLKLFTQDWTYSKRREMQVVCFMMLVLYISRASNNQNYNE